MSKSRMFTACLLLALSVFSLAWSTSSAAPADQVALATTLGPNENVSQTGEMSEAPQVAVFGDSVRAIWGERSFNAVAVSEKTVGGSWQPLKYFEENTFTKTQFADIAVAGDGTTHIVYAAESSIYHRSKPNGSTTWSGRNLVATDAFPNPVRMAAAPDGSVWVVWRDADGTALRYRRSTNGGLNWSGGDVAAQSGNMFAPDIAVGPDNQPHVVWYLRNVNPNGGVRYADWNGSGWTVGSTGSGYGADPVITVDSNNVQHIAYRQQSGSDWIIRHASRAAGQAWSAHENVRTTPGDAGYAPGLAVDRRGGVHISWSEFNAGGGRDVWYSSKAAAMQAFSAPLNISENGGGWNTRSAIAITESGSATLAHVIYQRGVRGQDFDEIYSRTVRSEDCSSGSGQPSTPSSLRFKLFLPLIHKGC